MDAKMLCDCMYARVIEKERCIYVSLPIHNFKSYASRAMLVLMYGTHTHTERFVPQTDRLHYFICMTTTMMKRWGKKQLTQRVHISCASELRQFCTFFSSLFHYSPFSASFFWWKYIAAHQKLFRLLLLHNIQFGAGVMIEWKGKTRALLLCLPLWVSLLFFLSSNRKCASFPCSLVIVYDAMFCCVRFSLFLFFFASSHSIIVAFSFALYFFVQRQRFSERAHFSWWQRRSDTIELRLRQLFFHVSKHAHAYWLHEHAHTE